MRVGCKVRGCEWEVRYENNRHSWGLCEYHILGAMVAVQRGETTWEELNKLRLGSNDPITAHSELMETLRERREKDAKKGPT